MAPTVSSQDVPVLAPLLHREVFYRVLTGPLGPRLRALAQSDSQARHSSTKSTCGCTRRAV